MKNKVISSKLIVSELAGADLGDTRRTSRVVRIAKSAARSPASSLPNIAGSVAELEATYRLLNNDDVAWEKLLEPHQMASANRCRAVGSVIISHDSTEFQFEGKREGLGPLRGKGARGFFGHFALAIAERSDRMPLGVLHVDTLVRTARKKKRTQTEMRDDPNKESLKWAKGVVEVESRIPADSAIHVMDRESDDYELLSFLLERGSRFVCRSATNRVLDTSPKTYLHNEMRSLDGEVFREVALSRRKQEVFKSNRKKFPARAERKARLSYAAVATVICRPGMAKPVLPKEQQINVVRVWETDAPSGTTPIEWILLTNLPVETQEDVERIIDAYRTRWVIEEYFKAVKTGCAYESRGLETLDALLRTLAIFIPIAVQLLVIKALARNAPEGDARELMSELRIRLLRKFSDYKMGAIPTFKDVLWSTARLGGHLKQNGPPGWQTLSKGMVKLLDYERGALALKDVINC